MTSTEKATFNGTSETPIPFNKLVSHLKSFPIISDSLSTIQAHPLGQRSISIYSTAYDTFVKPFTPYLVKVNDMASPYVGKVDDIADQGLGKLEEKFPIVKEPTENVKTKVAEQLQTPKKVADALYGTGLDFANEKKDYVFRVYHEERAKEETQGYIPMAKAGITTTFVVAYDGFQWVVKQLSSKKEINPEGKPNGVRDN